MKAPLDGILVVSLEHAVAAPYTSSRLADAGARVIKIERPEGDFARGYDSIVAGQSAYFVWLNRGKESMVLDLKAPEDASVLHQMIARADVFIQNLGPGAADRLGFGSADLRTMHPRLITCDFSGYGQDGPYQDMKAYDLLLQAETGLAGITGAPEAPGRVGVSVCDIATGMSAYSGILEAIIERGRTGAGKAISVSMFDCLADWMTVPFLYQEHTGVAPGRVGLNHPSIAPYGAYRVKSGELVVISIQNHAEWVSFCTHILNDPQLIEDPRFAGNEERVQNSALLDAEIDAVFGSTGKQELAERLRSSRIAYGFVNSVKEFSEHPQLRRTSVQTPGGPIDIIAPPVRFADETVSLRPVPALGEHTNGLMREFASAGKEQVPSPA